MDGGILVFADAACAATRVREVISAKTADLPEARKPVVERERDIRNQKRPTTLFFLIVDQNAPPARKGARGDRYTLPAAKPMKAKRM